MTHDFDQETRLRFLQIDEKTREILRHFSGVLEPRFREFIDAFYDHVTGEPNLAALIGDQTEHLKEAQFKHWMNLFEARFDTAYFESVTRIGLAHERIGLHPRWYIGGYGFMLRQLHGLAVEAYDGHNEYRVEEVITAVTSAVLLDMDLAISVYQDALIQERQEREKRLDNAINAFDSESGAVFDALNEASVQMSATAEQLKSNSDQMSQKASAVASASNQTSANVQTVAAASEELSASISEIARQVQQSSDLTRDAVSGTEEATQKIRTLSDAGDQIGTVLDLINQIASQTKLLSLNATIEAARAGDAGRGFGVVAAEVKNLANQTEKATHEISEQIAAIQNATGDAVNAVDGIGTIIARLDEASSVIASAVEEQNSTTQDIAGNVQQVAVGTSNVNENITNVSATAEDTDQAADQVLAAGDELKNHSARLRDQINAFLEAVRAA